MDWIHRPTTCILQKPLAISILISQELRDQAPRAHRELQRWLTAHTNSLSSTHLALDPSSAAHPRVQAHVGRSQTDRGCCVLHQEHLFGPLQQELLQRVLYHGPTSPRYLHLVTRLPA